MDNLFPTSYESSRARFLRDVELLRAKWPASRLETHPLKDFPDLSIDWLWAEPRRKENLVIISTAQHGIEGYVGSAMLKLFMDEFAPRLDPETTGVLLVHTINPWGMQHNRKVNESSVDLNRNFIHGDFKLDINPDYKALDYLVTPQHPVRAFWLEKLSFWMRAIRAIATLGVSRVSTAALLGQHHTPKGFFYGGTEHEEGTKVLMNLYQQVAENYEFVLQIDMHTGYGPRDQMSVIIPPNDPMPSAEASEKFDYPLVQKITREEFYAISGDMGEYYYTLRDQKFPDRKLFACGFEFGTFGNSLMDRIRSLRAMVLENQLHWHGAVNEAAAQAVRNEFLELYYPSDEGWRAKALADGRQATEGILRAYNLLK